MYYVNGFSINFDKVVIYNNQWLALEGVIIDKTYVEAVKSKFQDVQGTFHHFAIATNDLKNLSINWKGKATYVQSAAIVHDLGVFACLDDSFEQYAQDLGLIKKWLYAHVGRKIMNRNVKKVRNSLI